MLWTLNRLFIRKLKQFFKEQWNKIPPRWCEKLTNAWLCFLPLSVTQPINTFRGELLFHTGQVGLNSLWLNKLNHDLKLRFFSLLRLSLSNAKMYLMIWSTQVRQMCKKNLERDFFSQHCTCLWYYSNYLWDTDKMFYICCHAHIQKFILHTKTH